MLWYAFVLAALVATVTGHGRVIDPPGRASMWRYGFATRSNYDDNGLNCGGFGHQYNVNGGKCGICGDPFDMAQPRPHELGGIYGTGTIVAEYEEGQVLSVNVEITAYHKGYWVFKICTDPYSNDQSCFDKNLVELEEGGYKYYPTGTGFFRANYRLPDGLVCSHCVLQWTYITGHNWGVCTNGTQGLGCGNQEHFLACSDISISPGQQMDDIPAVPAFESDN